MDSSLYRDINRFAVDTSWAHGIGKVLAVYAVGLFVVVIVAGWWYARYQPDAPRAVAASIWAAAGTLIAVAVNQPITHAVARVRPYVTMPHVEVLVSRSHDFTFPSDHATAGAWIIAHYGGKAIRNLAIASTILAVVIAFARVYVGAHYPADVIAGLAIGATITLVGWVALHRPLTALTTMARDRRPLRPLITAPSSLHNHRQTP